MAAELTSARRLTVLVALAALAACGGGSGPSGPSRHFAQGTSTETGTRFTPHTSFCRDFYNARAGEVVVSASPATVHLRLGVGSCAAPGAALVEKDAFVMIDAPEGTLHVVVSNPTDLDTGYTLRLTYWYGS